VKESSNIKQINAPVERVYATLSNLENLRPIIEKAQNDENLKAKLAEQGQENALDGLRDIVLTADSITIPVPMVGSIALSIIEREENKTIKFATEQSPIAAKLWIQLLPVTAETSKMKLTIDADIPFMLKAMIGSKVKDGIEKMADMLAMVQY